MHFSLFLKKLSLRFLWFPTILRDFWAQICNQKMKIHRYKTLEKKLLSSTVGKNALLPTVDRCMKGMLANFPSVLYEVKVKVSGHELRKILISMNAKKNKKNVLFS